MSHGLMWSNFIAYCLQVGLLTGVAGWVPAALRMRSPKARLIFWHALLAACLLIPLIQPWRSEVITAAVQVTGGPTIVVTHTAAAPSWHIPTAQIVRLILLAGCIARLCLLVAGFWRLRRYRRNSIPLEPAPAWAVEADLRLSTDIASPVTFGLRKPVVLLPANFPEFDAGLQSAILCHEIMHVRRHDWLAMLAEELVRAGLWFHPAIWWLLGEVQLAREQTVDSAVIDMTKAREQYVDALLTVAGAALQMDLAPAPLFLRKRHLKHRVVSILKEKRMSKTRTVSTLAAGLAMLAGACWFVTAAFPLSAEPQAITDALGVSVDVQGARLMHRSPVMYPFAAEKAGIEGTVIAQVKLDANGNVSDASILSGPDQLRKPVLESVLAWHFASDSAGSSRQIVVTFHAPDPSAASAPKIVAAPVAPASTAIRMVPGTLGSVPMPDGGVLRGTLAPAPAPLAPPSPDDVLTVQAIEIRGVQISDEELLAKLPPLHVGDRLSRRDLSNFFQAVRQLDEHLSASTSFSNGSTGVTVHISAPYTDRPMSNTVQTFPNSIPVGGPVQNNKLISKVDPVYPEIAKAARISGTVELAALIGPDGHMQQLSVVSGHPLLRQAALDAVKQWVYAPTLLNEKPVAVSTTIDVVFTLNQ